MFQDEPTALGKACVLMLPFLFAELAGRFIEILMKMRAREKKHARVEQLVQREVGCMDQLAQGHQHFCKINLQLCEEIQGLEGNLEQLKQACQLVSCFVVDEELEDLADGSNAWTVSKYD